MGMRRLQLSVPCLNTKGELLPIVAMTANAFTEDVILAKSAGMNEHIAKPLDMEKLNRMLHEWM